MPTGYTHIVSEGATFEQFVWRCARGMGALIMMRDDPMDAPIPEFEARTDYYDEQIRQAEAKLLELRSMTIEQANAAAKVAHEAACSSLAKWQAEDDAANTAYREMRAKVSAWEPPTPEHAGLRAFMLEQLDISISDYKRDPPVMLDGHAWLNDEIEKAARTLKYSHEERAKEIVRTNARNAWVRALATSVPIPAKLRP